MIFDLGLQLGIMFDLRCDWMFYHENDYFLTISIDFSSLIFEINGQSLTKQDQLKTLYQIINFSNDNIKQYPL